MKLTPGYILPEESYLIDYNIFKECIKKITPYISENDIKKSFNVLKRYGELVHKNDLFFMLGIKGDY